MARDLIPPPSPAGRPTSPGGTPNLIELPPEPPRSGAEPAQAAANLPPSQFRNRFGFLIGALAGVVVAVGAVVALVLLEGDTAAREGFAKHWSAWQPPQTDTTQGAQEIAAHVGAEYKQADGSQLTMVNGNPLPSFPIALRPAHGPVVTFSPDHGVMYTLDGLGKDGAMTGKASPQRLQLLRREALELALYTFRYIKDVDTVMALLPTIPKGAPTQGGPTTQPQAQAVFYRPGDLKQQLQVPLTATMSARTPVAGTIQDGRAVDALTLSNMFKWSLHQAQTGQPYLLLDRSGAG